MKPEKLDSKLTLQRLQVAFDDKNQPIDVWSDIATVWASKQDLSDGERVRAQAVGASITTRFQIRWSSLVADLNPKDRVLLDQRIYDISGVKDIGRREGLEITAVAVADAVPSSIVGLDFNNMMNSQYLPLMEAMIDG